MSISMYRALTCAVLLLMTSTSNAQTAFQDNFTGGYDQNIWNLRSGSNGTPFGCTFTPAMISPNPEGITLNVVPGQCAELQSKAFYQYGSVQGSLKTGYTPGTVSSIFTYTSWWDAPGRAWQEIDIEFLPSLGNLVHTNVIYQPFNGQYESWELDIGLDQYGLNIQQDLVTIGFEWSENRIQWYLDTASGRQIIRTVTRSTSGNSSLNEIPAYAWPTDPTRIMINHWHGDNTADGLFFPGQYSQQDAWAYYDYLAYQPVSSVADNSIFVQAEDYTVMSGVYVTATGDVGGGQHVGGIDAGDWLAYAGITISESRDYRIEYRVASPAGAALSLDLNGGQTVLGQLTIPATGSWQEWVTVSHVVSIPAGEHQLGIFALAPGWDINWLRIMPL